jgi:phasin
MNKTAAKPAEASGTVEFPSFDANKATDQFRSFAEKGVEQAKEAYARLKAGAEDAQKAVESTVENAKSVGSELTLKAIVALRANAEAGFSHVEALVGAKSLSELVELQTAYLRKVAEMNVEHGKEFQALTSKAATEVSKPVKEAVEKALKELKVA